MSLKNNIKQLLKKVNYWGFAYFCPVCESPLRTFFPFGEPSRQNALCPVCSSLERHRLDWIFFKRHTNLFDDSSKKMLHVAPEYCFESHLKNVVNLDYITADIMDPRAMMQMDITNIPFPNNTFDIIYCSHVLEHIVDDRKAIREFYRVCKLGGWAVLQVPINAKVTIEDPEVITPEDRKRLFGQKDHVRRCGPDYIERMEEEGFKTSRLLATDIVEVNECKYFGFQENRLIFYCQKCT